jgi:hypothetical protein
MLELPTIRLEIEGMRHAILHAFSQHNRDIEEYLQKETEKFVKGYDFQAAVAKSLGPLFDEIVRKAVERHFTYGPGREAIEKAIQDSLPS